MSVAERPFPPPPLAGTRWRVNPSASRVEFSVRQLWGLSVVRGRFGRFDGGMDFGGHGDGRAELRIEAASVDTGNRRRDRHLRGEDFFDASRHPLVRFVADVTARPLEVLEVAGDLEAAGRSVALEIAAVLDDRGDRLELAGRAEVDARSLGMTWSPIGHLETPVTLAVHASLDWAE